MKHGKKTIKEASEMIDAMRRANVPAFHSDVFGLEDRKLIQDMIYKAKKHCAIQERWCSEEMSEAVTKLLEKKEQGLEKEITTIASKFGLRAHFDGDPRGFTVKLHAPESKVFNTWGGAETGYGIGEN